jgi:hypothetical protein
MLKSPSTSELGLFCRCVKSEFDVLKVIFVKLKKCFQKSMHKLLSILIFSFTLISFSINFFMQIK